MSIEATNRKQWKEVITPDHSLWKINFKELFQHKDLLIIWMKRDIFSIYKQTILGPLWFVLQPILTTATYLIVFSRFGKFTSSGIPPVLFYLSGIILWSYFSDCITKTATFLKDSNAIFSKVYFPKLIIPVSIVLTNLVKFGIQFVLFLLVYCYLLFSSHGIYPNNFIFLFPILLLLIACLGFGSGLVVASLTTRYKDFAHLLTFGIQLLMFISPVFFSVTDMPGGFFRNFIMANPMTGIIEAFRYGFTGSGYLSSSVLLYDVTFIMILLFTGIIIFNATEKNFVDII